MSLPADITEYIAEQAEPGRSVCALLAEHIDAALPDAESKVWHAHPVWFLDGNPVTGFAVRKNDVQLLFWSGQSFSTPGLAPEGTFKAAQARFTDPAEIDAEVLALWLAESREIQWDYRNIRARKGRLEPLTPQTR